MVGQALVRHAIGLRDSLAQLGARKLETWAFLALIVQTIAGQAIRGRYRTTTAGILPIEGVTLDTLVQFPPAFRTIGFGDGGADGVNGVKPALAGVALVLVDHSRGAVGIG